MVDRQALPRATCARPACRSCRRCSSSPASRFPLLEAEVVVKPTESGGSRDTERYDQETEKDAERLARASTAAGAR